MKVQKNMLYLSFILSIKIFLKIRDLLVETVHNHYSHTINPRILTHGAVTEN